MDLHVNKIVHLMAFKTIFIKVVRLWILVKYLI